MLTRGVDDLLNVSTPGRPSTERSSITRISCRFKLLGTPDLGPMFLHGYLRCWSLVTSNKVEGASTDDDIADHELNNVDGVEPINDAMRIFLDYVTSMSIMTA